MSDTNEPYPDLDPEVEATIGHDVKAARAAQTDAATATRRTAAVITDANKVLAALRARDDHFTERVRATIIGGQRAS